MKLTATVTGTRAKKNPLTGYANNRGETEQYTFAELDLDGHRRFIAGALRALADDIDPSEVAS